MKRITAVFISLFLVVGFVACNFSEMTDTYTSSPIVMNPSSDPSPTMQPTTITQPPDTTQPPNPTKPTEPAPSEPYLVYSPYVVRTAVREYLGDDYELYCKMIDSIINYDGCVSGFESEEQFFNLWKIIKEECPPAQKLCANYLTSDEPYTYKDGVCQIAFQYERSEHNEIYKKFADRITTDLSCINKEDTEVAIIAKLHMHVSTTMFYADQSGYLYESIMNNKGICGNYAEYLMLLLSQAGIECHFGGGSGAGIDHAWVIAKMNGQYYHFDPTWEFASRDWSWFAIGDELRHMSLDPSSLGTLQTYGDWDNETNKWLPPKECPATYCQENRNNGDPPWLW